MKPSRQQIEKASRQYVKLVEWSEEDQCFIGSAPPLIGQSCHGATEAQVLTQLNRIVEKWVTTILTEGKPLPEGSANREFSGKFVVRISPSLHKKAALQAMARGDSLNHFVAEALAKV